MSAPIADYALIGDCHTGALVSRDGSIDWLCLPRFDSGACFAALLGTADHGRWQIRPAGKFRAARRYRGDTLILETDFETPDGTATVVDFMPPRTAEPTVVRTVVGSARATMPMRLELVIRPDYGSLIPWVRKLDGGIHAIVGPDGFQVTSDIELRGEDFKTIGDFAVAAGQSLSFVMTWFPSHEKPLPHIDPQKSLSETESWWRNWSERCQYRGQWRDAVMRSLITLKALTYAPTGGIVAALTTSLPEQLGGHRNWDYRCCWPRDSAFTLFVLAECGYEDEAMAWRDWLLRAVAGAPAQIQSVYGVAGEHRLEELELPWLPGYENSVPVRIGNGSRTVAARASTAKSCQQCIWQPAGGCRRMTTPGACNKALIEHLESIWQEPDDGIWEIRGGSRHFTHSKVLAWVAVDRAVKMVEDCGLDGPLEHWKTLRETIHDDVCRQGFNTELNSFVQTYGSQNVDASLLMLPLVGFLPADDARIRGTLKAVEDQLLDEGFVKRYDTGTGIDGLKAGEGKFLLCSFWLAENLMLQGRRDEALDLFQRLLDLRNDVGLLSEEYDPHAGRLLGNFPQAFSHVALINTARNLSVPAPASNQSPKG